MKSASIVVIALLVASQLVASENAHEQAATLGNQAAVEQAAGRYDRAAEFYQTALDRVSPGTLLAAEIQTRLGTGYQDLGRYFEAEKMHRGAIASRRPLGAEGDSLVASASSLRSTSHSRKVARRCYDFRPRKVRTSRSPSQSAP